MYICVCACMNWGISIEGEANALTNICFFIWDCNIDELVNITVSTIYLYFYCM